VSQKPAPTFELHRCAAGDRWFPWNYGRTYASGRVGMARFDPEPGLFVINAVDRYGRVLGSCSLRVGSRHSEYVLGDEEYRYGALAAGPAYFWKDDGSSPWIVLLKSFWVRPSQRRKGIARAFAEFARDIGLPAYLAFANKKVEAWFHSEYRPSARRSRLQRSIATAMRAKAGAPNTGGESDFTVYVQAEAMAWRVWRSWHGGTFEGVDLDDALCWPDRMDEWAADSGEEFELGFSDSAFAHDRCYGYVLEPWCEGWRAAPDADPIREPDEAALEAAEAALREEPVFAAGAIEGWITDTKAMRAYASVRWFLRNLEWREFRDLDDAARELFVRDLRDEPRGLWRFSALVSPVRAPDA
jgi:hypothetical protein